VERERILALIGKMQQLYSSQLYEDESSSGVFVIALNRFLLDNQGVYWALVRHDRESYLHVFIQYEGAFYDYNGALSPELALKKYVDAVDKSVVLNPNPKDAKARWEAEQDVLYYTQPKFNLLEVLEMFREADRQLKKDGD
jgi:hypothetical protein